jgi:hypothetical protein
MPVTVSAIAGTPARADSLQKQGRQQQQGGQVEHGCHASNSKDVNSCIGNPNRQTITHSSLGKGYHSRVNFYFVIFFRRA